MSKLHIPRIPKGCDQQGRFPEAHAINEDNYQPWYSWADLAWSLALAIAILSFLGIVTGWLI